MSEQDDADRVFAAAIVRDAERRTAAQRAIAGDTELAPVVPQAPETPEDKAAARQLMTDLWAIINLFAELNPVQRQHLLTYLGRLVKTEVSVLPQGKWP